PAAATALASAVAECPFIGFAAAVSTDWAMFLSSVLPFEAIEGWSGFEFELLPGDPFERSCDGGLVDTATTGACGMGFAAGGSKLSRNLNVETPTAADFATECTKVSGGDCGIPARGCEFDGPS